MPHIHVPTLLFVLGACALCVAVAGMLLNEGEAKKRAAARRKKAAKGRVLDSRTSTSVKTSTTARDAKAPGRSATTTPRAMNPTSTQDDAAGVAPKDTLERPEPLHSDSPVLDEAQQLAELMAEDAPERIVAILREWMREDQ
jgi:flagellar biosynthesis/type III secretory pathway M-ring protein FliF/YscJ